MQVTETFVNDFLVTEIVVTEIHVTETFVNEKSRYRYFRYHTNINKRNTRCYETSKKLLPEKTRILPILIQWRRGVSSGNHTSGASILLEVVFPQQGKIDPIIQHHKNTSFTQTKISTITAGGMR